ncbi:LIM domain-binding protein 2, partial [Blomia tropicalis]
GHSNNLGNPNVNSVPHPMLCGPPPLPPQNGPPMTMGPYNPGANSIPHVMHHPPHPMQHPTGPPPPPNHMQPPHGRHTPFYEMRQPEFRIFEMNKRLLQRSDESDNLWWDAFSTEFFEDDATLTVTFCLEDGPKRYTIGRTLIPRYFRSIFEGGVTELQINLKHFKESYHTTTITLDCDQSSIITYHGKTNYKLGPYPHPQNDPMKDQIMKENSVFVCTEGRLILEFMFDDCMRIKSWHFSTRHHQELISRGLVAMQQAQQDPAMMEQLTKNITRQGLTNSTLNYLRLCVILEPMQELMSRHKAYALSPRDCLKTTLFQKWQRMVAPPETSRPPSKRRKRKSSTNAGTTTNSKKKNNQNNMSPVPPPFTLATQDVMVVGEPSLMGGEFGDEDERLITRLENNQYDPSAASGTNGLEDADDFNSLGSSTSGGTNVANNGGNNSAGIIGPGTNGGPPNWPPNGSNNSNNTNGANSGPPQGANGPIPGPPGPNGPNSQDDSKKQSPNLSQ